jgi:1-deoxy-D-xylulose-5-phosphate synthase
MKNYCIRFSKNLRRLFTVEDGCIQGGFGSAILEFMADHNYFAEIKRLGIPDDVI